MTLMGRTSWKQVADAEGLLEIYKVLQQLRQGLGAEQQALTLRIPSELQHCFSMDGARNRLDKQGLLDVIRAFLVTLPDEDQKFGQVTWAVSGSDDVQLAGGSGEHMGFGQGWTQRKSLWAKESYRDERKVLDDSDRIVLAFARYLSSKSQPPGEVALDLTSYLQSVLLCDNELLFGDAAHSWTDDPTSPSTSRMTLNSVWTPIRVAPQPHDSHRSDRLDSKSEEFDLLSGLDSTEHRRVVVLGGAGSGKSTALARKALELAEVALNAPEDNASRVPIHVHLRHVKLSASPTIAELWTGVRARPADGSGLHAIFEPLLASGRALVLLDGLDEIPDESVGTLLPIVELLADHYPQSGIVVSCREFEYGLESPSRRMAMPVLHLLPFDLSQQTHYVRVWYQAQQSLRPRQGSDTRCQKLIDSLEHSEELQEIGGTPLHLAIMAVVHTDRGELPENRALLYGEMVAYLLAESPRWRASGDAGAPIANADILRLAYKVGFEFHRRQEDAPRDFRGLTSKELYEIVQEHIGLFAGAPVGTPDWKSLQSKVEQYFHRLVFSNGLLIEQGDNYYDFSHKQFREYLAGLFVGVSLDNFAFSMPLAQRTHWREPLLLLANNASAADNNIGYVLSFVEELCDSERTDPKYRPEDAILAAEILVEIGKHCLLVQNRANVLTPSTRTRGGDGLWPRTASQLVQYVEDEAVQPATRVRAADALGILGDPRLVDGNGRVRDLSTRLVTLPAVTLSIGGTEVLPPTFWEPMDSQPRRLTFRSFRVARYPVTNIEYAEFIDAGGYDEERWWQCDEAKLWRAGDVDFVGLLESEWVKSAEFDYAPELADGTYAGDLSEMARELCRTRSAPYFFGNRRFNLPTQPVVGVNFWEANAYCAWQTERGSTSGWLSKQEVVRLPTEWEWERTALRDGSGRSFPWGDQWDPSASHTHLDGLQLARATPVGCFGAPDWPLGPTDLAGNIWEWTASRALSYDKAHDGQREAIGGLSRRAIRGSSWYDPAPELDTHCSFRGHDSPTNVYIDAGFRVVVDEKGSFSHAEG